MVQIICPCQRIVKQEFIIARRVDSCKMRQTFNVAPLGLMLALLVVICVCCASVESRGATASPANRKPPFNGSIFGKRSSLPALEGTRRGYRPAANTINQQLNTLEMLAQEQQQLQQDAIVRASINQCLAEQQQNSSPDSTLNTLCALILNGARQQTPTGQRDNWSD